MVATIKVPTLAISYRFGRRVTDFARDGPLFLLGNQM